MSRQPNYPLAQTYKLLEGFDIYRGTNLIVAVVAVESEGRKDVRLYRWQKRKDAWKVDLCRMSVGRWNWDQISRKVKELIEKYQIQY